MFDFAYNDIIEDAPGAMRAQERKALESIIQLLRGAAAKGARSVEAVNALYQLRVLWGVFLDDLEKSGERSPRKSAREAHFDRHMGEQGNRPAQKRRLRGLHTADRNQRNHSRRLELRRP